MAKKQRGNPPSRKKYQEANPVLSFSVPRAVYERVQALKGSEGAVRLEIFMAGLGLFEVRARTEQEITRKAYDKGYDDGANSACDCFCVTYPCNVCGKEMTVDTDEEKKAIRKFLTSGGWHHGDCSDPYE